MQPTTLEGRILTPEGWLAGRWGGGKYKMNLHHGLHFVNTRNFKPGGAPRRRAAPSLEG